MSLADDVRRLHERLEATEELPVRPDASPWLGEAAAITADLVDADLPEPAVQESDIPASVVVERVQRVAMLLDEIETTGNPAADDHVDAAEGLAKRIATVDE